MEKLSDKRFWDSWHQRKQPLYCEGVRKRRGIEDLLRNSLFQNYAEYFLWEVIYPKFLCGKEGAKVIEIGSAPGTALVWLNEKFGLVPYGIEYSQAGVELNMVIFASHGLEPANVIHADFLSGDIETRFAGQFDVVVSHGFIEHFDNPKEVVSMHTALLKRGGILIISIPNLEGVNKVLSRFFDRDFFAMHNIGIMEKGRFAELFDDERLSAEYCGYYGTFNFNLFMAKKRSIRDVVLMLCKVTQLLLNLVFRLLFGKKGAESKTFSPYLLFIGVRGK